jgi:hypothetical protein
VAFSHTRLSNNRSVMSLDVRGRTRATLMGVNDKSRGDGGRIPQNLQWWTLIQVVPQIFVIFQNFKRSPWIRPPRFQPRSTPLATLKESACVLPDPKGPGNPLNLLRARDWGLQLFSMNEEFPVSASHKLALITSLPFVHTARRYYRLDGLVRSVAYLEI